MAIAKRIGNIQPFIRTRSLDEENRNGATEVGVVTYRDVDGLDTQAYQVTSMTVGARADHLTDALGSLTGSETINLTVDAPLSTDKELLRDKPEASADKSGNGKATEVA